MNPWMSHLKKFRASHPGMGLGAAMKAAKKTYRRSCLKGGDPAAPDGTVKSMFGPADLEKSAEAVHFANMQGKTGGRRRRRHHRTRRHRR